MGGSVDVDPVQDGRVVGDGRHEAFVVRVRVGEIVACERVVMVIAVSICFVSSSSFSCFFFVVVAITIEVISCFVATIAVIAPSVVVSTSHAVNE
jgi:hypothetical protein